MIYQQRACEHCGAQFTPTASGNKTCSSECRFRLIAAPFAGRDGCWEWPKSCQPSGYGQFTLRPVPNQVVVTAHRMAYETLVGPITAGLCVMHKCDNRRCFNPDHLQLGTLADNNHDMLRKKRASWQAPTFKPAEVCLLGHEKTPTISGRWKCLDCEMIRKRAQRAAERGNDAVRYGRGMRGFPRREVGQTTSRNRSEPAK